MRWSKSIVGLLLFWVVIGTCSQNIDAAEADSSTDLEESAVSSNAQKFQISIPRQSLSEALVQLSTATNVNIVGLSATMASWRSPQVNGLMTVEEALLALLQGSNINYEVLADDSFLLVHTGPLSIASKPKIARKSVLEEILVIADKRTLNLQRTASSVSHLSQDELALYRVEDIRDVAQWVPGLEFVSTGPQESVLVQLRGVGTTNITEIADGPVSIHVDGIYSPRSQGVASLLHDVQHVEVLRGPQGTLFGRNSSSGSINIYNNLPSLEGNELSIEGGIGNYRRTRFQLMGNWKVNPELALRLSMVSQEHDPYTTRLDSYQGLGRHYPAVDADLQDFETSQGNSSGLESQDRYSVRLSSLWRPSDRLTWFLSAERYQDSGSGSAELDPTLIRKGIRGVVLDTDPFVDLTNDVIRSKLSYEMGGSVSISYLLGLAQMRRSQLYDTDQGRTGDYEVERTVASDFNFYSHEVLIQGGKEKSFNWLFGVFSSRERNSILFAVDQQNRGGQRVQTSVPSWVSGLPGAGVFYANQPERRAKSLGAYAQLEFPFSSKNTLTLGGRYNRDTKSDTGGRNLNCRVPSAFGPYSSPGSLGVGAPNPGQIFADSQIQAALDRGTFAGLGSNTGIVDQPCWIAQVNDVEASWSNLSGLLRVEHQVNEDILWYGSLSSGFKAGHIQDAGNVADPETVISAEIGVKSQWWQDSLRVNASLFVADYEDLQFSDDDRIDTNLDGIPDAGGNTIVRNASNARVNGLELEVYWKPSDQHDWRLTAALTDARFKEFDIPDSMFGDLFNPFSDPFLNTVQDNVNLSGNTPPRVPDWAIALGYRYTQEFSKGVLELGGSLDISDEYFLDIFNRDSVAPGVFQNLPNGGSGLEKQAGFVSADLSAAYGAKDESWQVSIWVKNITDEPIRTNSNSFLTEHGFVSNYKPPRTYGIDFSYRY